MSNQNQDYDAIKRVEMARAKRKQAQANQQPQEEVSGWQVAGETIGDVLGNIIVGGQQALEGLYDFGASIVGEVGGLFSEDFKNDVQEHIAYNWTQDTTGEWVAENTKNSAINTMGEKGQNIVRGISQGVGQMLPMVATGGIAKGLGATAKIAGRVGLGTLGLSATGSGTAEALNEGANYEQALGYGALSGATEMLTEKLVGGAFEGVVGKGVADKLINRIVSGASSKPLLRKGLKILIDASGEGLEEMVSEVLSPQYKKMLYNKDTPNATREEVLEAGIIGALTSIAYRGSVGTITNKIETKTQGTDVAIGEELERVNTLEDKRRDSWNKGKYSTELESNIDKEIEKSKTAIGERLQKFKPNTRAKVIKTYNLSEEYNEDGTYKKKDNVSQNGLQELKHDSRYVYRKRGTSEQDIDKVIKAVNKKYADKNGVKNALKVNETELTEEEQKSWAKVKRTASSLDKISNSKKNLVLVDAEKNFHAVIVNGDTILINKARLTDGTDFKEELKWAKDIVHEYKHSVEGSKANRELDSMLWENKVARDYAFARVVPTYVKPKELDAIKEKIDKGEKLTAKEEKALKDFRSEMGAFMSEKVLGNADFIDKIVSKDSTMAKKVVRKLKEAIDSVKSLKSSEARAEYKEYVKIANQYIKASESVGKVTLAKELQKILGNVEEDKKATKRETMFSLESVEPIKPTSSEWRQTTTSEELKKKFPNFWNITAETSTKRNPTQIKGTTSTYKKIYDILKAEDFDGTILDASSGLGYGTQVGVNDYSFKVEDIEPYPDKTYKPKYTDYSKLNKKFDVIISNAVLNVLPQDQRDALVKKMATLLNDGGRMFINVRGNDVDTLSSNKNNVKLGEMEWYVDSTGSYQKGFTKEELTAYLEDALGEDYYITPTSKFGKTAVVVTKKDGDNIQFSMNIGGEEVQGRMEEVKDLVALHNLSEENYNAMLDNGGLPMPSIAITKDSHKHENYGDITLVFRKDTIDPKANKENKVYSKDAWTPTFPRIEHKVNREVRSKIHNLYYKYVNVDRDLVEPIYSFANTPEDEIQNFRKEKDIINHYLEDMNTMNLFLKETTGEKVAPIIEETKVEISEREKEKNKKFINALGSSLINEYMNLDSRTGSLKENRIAFINEHKKDILNAVIESIKTPNLNIENNIKNMEENWGTFDYYKVLKSAVEYTKNKGIKIEKAYNREATEKAIKDKVDITKYEEWLHSLFDGIIEKTGIRNSKEYYTPSGNPRSFENLHYEYTLENIVKAMKEDTQVGKDGMFGMGLGSLEAKLSKEFKSIKDIKDNESNLTEISAEEYEQYTEKSYDMLHKIETEMKKGFEEKSFLTQLEYGDQIRAIISEIAEKKLFTLDKINKYFERENFYRINYNEKIGNDILTLFRYVKAMERTGYFEAKPRRVVNDSEVYMAVFKSEPSAETLANIKKHNAPYMVVPQGKTRQEVIAEMDDIKFSMDSNNNKLTEQQQKFFNASKVRDSQGRLLELYHGTSYYDDINVFKKGKYGYLGGGIYLTSEKRIAERYANSYGQGKTYELYANIQNPLYVESDNPVIEILRAIYGKDSVYNNRANKQTSETHIITNNDIKKLQGKGYDGIIWEYGGNIEVSVFKPNQIKLTSNKNPMPDTDDIRFSMSGKKAYFTEERIDDLIDYSGAGDSKIYAKYYATSINPSDFINLTTLKRDRATFDAEERGDFDQTMEDGYDFIKGLKEDRFVPYLTIDIKTGQVVGHNGRHRMRALEKLGVKQCSLAIAFEEDGRWVKQPNGIFNAPPIEPIQEVVVSSQFDDNFNTILNNLIPIYKANKELVTEEYGQGEDVDIKFSRYFENVGGTFSDRGRDDYSSSIYDFIEDDELLDLMPKAKKSRLWKKHDYEKQVESGKLDRQLGYAKQLLYNAINSSPTWGSYPPSEDEAWDILNNYRNELNELQELVDGIENYDSIIKIRKWLNDKGYIIDYDDDRSYIWGTESRSIYKSQALYDDKHYKNPFITAFKKVHDEWNRLSEISVDNGWAKPKGNKLTKLKHYGITYHAEEKKYYVATPSLRRFYSCYGAFDTYEEAYNKALSLEKVTYTKDGYVLGVVRKGTDYRNGKDIESTFEYNKEFQFKQVNFGNSLTMREKQCALNYSYDAWYDLAKFLGVKLNAISFDNRLKIGFATIGRGDASASYHPDLSAINLTKRSGAGCLAHEWWHALEDYLVHDTKESTFEGIVTHISPRYDKQARKLLDVIKYKEVNGKKVETDYYKDAKELDKVNKYQGYYSSSCEMLARAFAYYTFTEMDGRNDYLNGNAKGRNKAPYIYPHNESEYKTIANAFKEFFDNLKDRRIMLAKEFPVIDRTIEYGIEETKITDKPITEEEYKPKFEKFEGEQLSMNFDIMFSLDKGDDFDEAFFGESYYEEPLDYTLDNSEYINDVAEPNNVVEDLNKKVNKTRELVEEDLKRRNDITILKKLANNVQDKTFTREETESIIDTALLGDSLVFGENYGEVSKHTRKQVIDKLWEKLNSTSPDELEKVAEEIADYILGNAMLEDMNDSEMALKEEAMQVISILKPFLHKLDLNGIKGEIKYHFDNDNSPYLMWGGGKQKVDDLQMQLEEKGMTFSTDNPAQTFIEIYDAYRSAVKTLKENTKTTLKEAISEDEYNKAKAQLVAEIKKGRDSKGKETYISKLLNKYKNLAEQWKAKYRDLKARHKLEGNILSLAKDINKDKSGAYHNATQYKDDVFGKTIDKLAKINNRENINKSGTRGIIKDLREWYSKDNQFLQATNESDGYFDENIANIMDAIANGSGELSVEEMQGLKTILEHFKHLLKTYNQVYRNGKYEDAQPLADNYVNKIDKDYNNINNYNKNKKFKKFKTGSVASKYMLAFGDPRALMRRADFYEDGFYMDMLNELQQGLVQAQIYELDMTEKLDKFIKEHKGFKKELKKSTIEFMGKTIPLEQAMFLYMSTKREQNVQGLYENGFVIETKDGIVKFDGFKSINKSVSEVQKELESKFTQTQKEYIALAEKIFNEDCKKIKQEMDMIRSGYSNVSEDYYVPTRRYAIATKIDNAYQDELNAVNNSSFNKDTIKGAKQKLLIGELSQVLRKHVKGISLYGGLGATFDTFNRLYNMDINGNPNNPESVHTKTMESWKELDNYFKSLVADIQGVPRSKGVGNKATSFVRGGFAKFQLGANPKVWITQLSSFFASLNILSVGDVIKGLNGSVKNSEVDEFSQLARIRNNDNYVAKGEGVIESVGAVGDFFMTPIGKMDRFVIVKLFKACQYNIARTKGLEVGTKENKIEASKLLDKVILDTQQNALATERSAGMRSGNEFTKALTMFSSDAMKNIGRMIDAVGKRKATKIKLEQTTDASEKAKLEKELAKANKQIAKSVSANVSVAIFMALITQAFRRFYGRNDEDENFGEEMLLDGIGNLFGGLPIIRDVVNGITQGYDANNFATDMLNEIINSTRELQNVCESFADGKVTATDIGKALRSVVYASGQLLGIPFRNMYNLMQGITRTISPSGAYKLESFMYNKSHRAELRTALENDDTAMISTISDIIIGDNLTGDIPKSVRDELVKIMSEVDDTSLLPRTINEKGSFNKKEYELTPSQIKQARNSYSKAFKEIKTLMAQKSYKEATSKEKANMIRFINNYSYEKAISEVLNEETPKNVLFGELVPVDHMANIVGKCSEMKADKDMYGKDKVGSRKKKVVNYIQRQPLSANQKYIMLAYLGYKVDESKLRMIINRERNFDNEEKKRMLKYVGVIK